MEDKCMALLLWFYAFGRGSLWLRETPGNMLDEFETQINAAIEVDDRWKCRATYGAQCKVFNT
jgi:hypothetical protein